MLESYFGIDYTDEQKKRLLAVQAALEVATVRLQAGGSNSPFADIRSVGSEISGLADVIQEALKK